MRKTGLAVLCSVAAVAGHAQTASGSSVTVYGSMDAAVTWGRTGTGTTLPGGSVSAGPSATTTRLDSGVGPGSRLGFRGREDLGGGTAGVFLAEMGVAVNSGASQQGGLPFGRQIYVGLESGRWSLTLGRQYSPFNYALGLTDAMYGFYWGSSYAVSGFGVYESIGEPAGSGFDGAVARIDNSVLAKYTSGGFTARLMGAFGNQNTRGTARFINPQIQYSSGPWMVSASIARYRQGAGSITTAASPTWRTESIVGGSYDFGSFKLAGGYMEHRTPGGNLSAAATVGGAGASPFAFSWDKMKMAYIGAAIPLPVGKFSFDVSRLQYHYAAMPDGKAWAFGSVYEYPLSKRTSLYASYGHINNDSRSRTPLFATVVAIVNTGFGSKPSAFSVGMQHIF